MDEIEANVDALIKETQLYFEARANPLDHNDPNLRFCIKTIPEPDIHEQGYTTYLFHTMSHAHISATQEEIEEVMERAQLSPGDTVVYAYRINGPDMPTCVSISKVLSFSRDGKTPTEIMHIWPLEYFNKAINLWKLRATNVEDKREDAERKT